MSKRVTIVANGDSFWTQKYIKNVSIPLGHSVSLVSASNAKFADYYRANNVNVITTGSDNIHLGTRIDALLIGMRTIKSIKQSKPDLVVVHYAYLYILKILPLIQRRVKTVIAYWGSDLLRTRINDLLSVNKAVINADRIVAVTSDLKQKLVEVYGNEVDEKTAIIDMGVSAFESIDSKRLEADKSKKKIVGENNKGKIIITIGYNGGKAQQHDKVLKALAGLPFSIKQSICFILPMTYQREDADYLLKVESITREIGIESFILSKFMNDDEIADLCLATDIFINAQITDALSSSMLEQIYAGSTVLNGSWLHYTFLEENNIQCLWFDSFESLPNMVTMLLETRNTVSNNSQHEILRKEVSWEASKDKWRSVYDALL